MIKIKQWKSKRGYVRQGRRVKAHSQRYLTTKQKSKLGKKKRAKGLRFEFKILNKMKNQYPDTSFRSAGSHSLIDVLVREPDKIRYIVSRSTGYLAPAEKDKLDMFDRPYEQVEVWSRPTPKTIKKEYFKKANETRKANAVTLDPSLPLYKKKELLMQQGVSSSLADRLARQSTRMFKETENTVIDENAKRDEFGLPLIKRRVNLLGKKRRNVSMVKIFGEINGKDVEFNSLNEMREYPFNEADKVNLFGRGILIGSVQEAKDYTGVKNDKYGYSMNKKHKGQMGYYKREDGTSKGDS